MSVDGEKLYKEIFWALEDHARAGGTAYGAAAVVKRVGKAQGVEAAEVIPVFRPSRAELADAAWQRGRKAESKDPYLKRGVKK
jgi:hypothetical protein